METEQQAKKCNGTEVSKDNARFMCNLILRLSAVVATMVAAIVMGVDKETKVVTITVLPTLPPLSLPYTAQSNYSSAFVYFVVANAIVCFYSVLSLVISSTKKAKLATAVTIADLLVVALLFSALGAGMAIGVAGEKGVPKVRWNKVCNVYTKFCAKIIASVAVSIVACLAYVILVFLALVGRKNK